MSADEDLASFVDQLPIGAFRLDKALTRMYVNQRFSEYTGMPKGWLELATLSQADLPDERRRNFSRVVALALKTGEAQELEFTLQSPTQGPRTICLRVAPERDAAGAVTHIAGVAFDISRIRTLEDALRQSEERLRGIVDNSPVIVWMKDAEGRYVYLSRSFETRFRVRLEDWRGRTDFEFWPREDAERFHKNDLEVLRGGRTVEAVETAPDPDGRVRFWWVFKFPFQNQAGERFIGGVGVDITERRRAEEEVRLQSLTDELTGLYNRRGFLLLAEQEYKALRRARRPCALFFLDLDGLKRINDDHGHDAGDAALQDTARVMRAAFRDGDILGRIGGDEFAVFAMDCADADALVQSLRASVEAHNRERAALYKLSLSIGAVRVDPDAHESFEAVMARADERMYATKRSRST